MSRITIIDHHNANADQKALLDAIQSQLGMVPNFLKVFANSPVALKAFLGLHGVANEGSLSALTRERIALALAQQNACEYCLSDIKLTDIYRGVWPLVVMQVVTLGILLAFPILSLWLPSFMR